MVNEWKQVMKKKEVAIMNLMETILRAFGSL